ncbi:MAG: hypothetical protein AMXMBFR45_14970 [Gammaproteobacteria bacterium]|nr:MAG: DUF2065 domain-containing protein [Pseudomonadota bacterium]MBC6945232.1 DUF2065 domain-containing protein [Gammaproteobacteria bacterium]MCE7901123.1 DUF2065 domain-containing protein [Gammaproteobacteria bacterium PRO9]MDL1880091.1 DUF2065 domain-containing protein [Gammaproteobacteria bacterium PRO2]MCL4776288.1 DUF2065 family protein [Gammaproteobacteria bacterium]
MHWADLFAALALYLVIEGLLPFASPSAWRRSLELLARLSDAQLRVFGLTVVVSGLTLLVLVRGVG